MSAPDRHRAARARGKRPFTLPPGVEEEIEERRRDIAGAMSLLYGLHSILKNHEDPGPAESRLLAEAIEWIELSDITELVLVQLHSVLQALDSVELKAAARDAEESQP
jgi:hypothetical protein